MAIPKYNELFSNVLSLFSDEKDEYNTRHVKKIVADLLNLPPEERNFIREGNNEPLVEYNLGWTLTYLKKAGLIESKRRGYVNITKLGLKEIKENPNITEKDLYKFPSFVEFKNGKNKSNNDVGQSKLNKYNSTDYIKQINVLFNQYNSLIAKNLIKKMINCDLNVFKKLIHDLLLKLNYHEINIDINNLNEIEGIISQDALELDKIAICAVNKSENIKISDLQQFAGFIVSNGLTKGVFITTSSFNENISEYVENQTNLNIALIDGKKLSELVIKSNISTRTINTFELKGIDENYFKI